MQPDDAAPPSELDGAGAERRQITVLFCDLVGATALAEEMDPEDLRHVLRDYQQRCANIVRRFDGHVAQFLGDGLLVYFGYPSASADAPRRAVEAALAVVESMLAAKQDRRLPHELSVRAGLHTGPVVVGEMGDETQPQRLAVGATPNIAARVQAQAETNSVYVSDTTHALIDGYFESEVVGVRPLKGVSRPMKLHRVLGHRRASTPLDVAERRGFSDFVGRSRELELLTGCWAEAATEGRAVLIRGDAGLGKSRLVHEFLESVEGYRVLRFSASDYHEAESFYPITQYLERWAGFHPKDTDEAKYARLVAALSRVGHDDAASELAALFLLRLDASAPAPLLPSPKQHATVIHRLVLLFASLAEESRRLVLVFEDLHWADASTLDLLKEWLARRKSIPALTLCTARRTFQPTFAPGTEPSVLELEPLSRDAARAVADSMLQRFSADTSDELLGRVLDAAEGVPLYVEEIARTLAERSSEPPPSRGGGSSDWVPMGLQDSLMARLDRLGSAKSVVQLAAVVGREVPLAWLEKISLLGAESLHRELARIVAAGLMYARAEPEPAYVFTHALTREIAYQSLVKTAREDHHGRVAEMLAIYHPELVSKQPLVLAHHYGAAGQMPDAIRCLSDAGRRSLAASAFAEAIEIFRRALGLLPGVDATPERDALEIELCSALGIALISTRGYSSSEVEDTFTRARQLCERSGDVPLRILYGVWAVHLVRADVRGVNRLASLFERIADKSTDPDALLVARSCLGVRSFYRVDFAEARRHLALASSAIDTTSARAQHERMLGAHGFEGILSGPVWLAWIETLEGNEERAREEIRKATTLAEKTGDPYIFCQAAAHAASLSRELHDVDAARNLTAELLRVGTEHEFPFWLALGLCVRGWVSLKEGDPEGALAAVTQGLGLLDTIGAIVNRSYFASYLVEAHLETGRIADGLRAAEEALSLSRESLGPMYEPELLRLKGALLIELGEVEPATEHFRAALAESRLRGARLLELRAAMSLSSALRRQDKSTEAHDVLHASAAKWAPGIRGHEIDKARRALAQFTEP